MQLIMYKSIAPYLNHLLSGWLVSLSLNACSFKPEKGAPSHLISSAPSSASAPLCQELSVSLSPTCRPAAPQHLLKAGTAAPSLTTAPSGPGATPPPAPMHNVAASAPAPLARTPAHPYLWPRAPRCCHKHPGQSFTFPAVVQASRPPSSSQGYARHCSALCDMSGRFRCLDRY